MVGWGRKRDYTVEPGADAAFDDLLALEFMV